MLKIVIAVSILIGISSELPSQPREIDPPNSLRATVTENYCEFWFPEPNANGEWRWNNERFGSSDNNWQVEFEFDGYTYLIGFSDGMNHPEDQNRGPLKAMLAAGFSAVWKWSWELEDPSHVGGPDSTLVARVVTREGIETTQSGAGVLVRVTNPEWVQRFLTQRPESILFSRSVVGERYEREVQVNYPDQAP